MSCTRGIHCGNKVAFHTVIKSLFVNNATTTASTTTTRRKLTTATVTTATTTTTPPSPPQKLLDYNKLIKQCAKSFKKRNSAQKEAIEILKEMRQKGLEPNSQTYLRLISGMAFQRHRTHFQNARLQHWFDEFLKLDSAITPAVRRGTVDKLQKIIFHLSFRGHPNIKDMFLKMNAKYPMEIEYWHMAMTGCIKSRQMEDAEDLFKLLRKDQRATKTSYQILISSYLYVQDQASASRIFSYMLQDQVTADDATYKLFINYYINLPYDEETSETLFKLWQGINLSKDVDVPLDMVEKYLSYFGKHGELAKAEQVYLDVVKQNKQRRLNRQCVGQMNKIMIGFANKRQLPSALSLFYDLVGQGYKPSWNVTRKIVEACKDKKDHGAIEQLNSIVQEQSRSCELK